MAASITLAYVAFEVPDAVTVAQYARPSSDVALGTWTPSTGSDLAPMLDEVVADDGDYIASAVSPIDDTAKIALSAIDPPQPGTITLRIRGRWAS